MFGIRGSVGVIGSILYGVFDTSEELDMSGNFDAENVGGYAGIGYDGEQIPVTAKVEALFGDIEGVYLSVGIRF